jgi:hypothetical protein
MAADGSLVPGARITFTPAALAATSTRVWETSEKGMVVVSGIKPGVYQVRVTAAQCSYQGLLLIRSADPKDETGRHMVAFTLECGCTPDVLEDSACLPSGAGLLDCFADPLLAGAAATAAALSLTLGREQEGPIDPVASP